MWGKYFSGREEKNFYLPGQEIKIDKSFSFKNYTCEKDPLSTCKNRVAFATLMFLLVYAVIGVRLFSVQTPAKPKPPTKATPSAPMPQTR